MIMHTLISEFFLTLHYKFLFKTKGDFVLLLQEHMLVRDRTMVRIVQRFLGPNLVRALAHRLVQCPVHGRTSTRPRLIRQTLKSEHHAPFSGALQNHAEQVRLQSDRVLDVDVQCVPPFDSDLFRLLRHISERGRIFRRTTRRLFIYGHTCLLVLCNRCVSEVRSGNGLLDLDYSFVHLGQHWVLVRVSGHIQPGVACAQNSARYDGHVSECVQNARVLAGSHFCAYSSSTARYYL